MNTATQSEHETVDELIPWLVNGTLSDSKQSLVERHVRSCLVCRRAVEEQTRVRELMLRQSDESIGVEEGFRALMARVDARSPARRRSVWPATRNAGHGAWAMAAGVLLAVGVFAWIATTRTPVDSAPAFQTVTDPAAATESLRVDVVFVEGLGDSEAQALIAEFDARIVAGPTELGRYTLELPPDRLLNSSVEALLIELRDDDRVRFAARSFIGGDEAR